MATEQTDDSAGLTVLTEYFPPEEASTAQLLSDLASGLATDFDVSVLTAYPSYHDDDTDATVPRRETVDGVDVTRFRSTRFHKDSLALRVVNWVSFLALVTVGLLWRRPSGALLVLSNPPVLPFAAWFHKRLTGAPYVYLIHDVYPDMPVALGMLDPDGLVARTWERAMRAVYRDADRIVVLGDAMKEHVVDVMADDPGFDAEAVAVIHNWQDPEFIQPAPKEGNEFAAEHGTRDRFTLLYSGNVGRFHDTETAIEAIDLLEDRGRDDVQMLVIGDGAEKERLRELVAARGIDNVRFLPFQPRERLPETLTCGDAALVGVDPAVSGLCVSSKLYSSLAAGMPVLAVTAPDDEVARVVEGADCGTHVAPGNAEAVADVLAAWADSPALVDRLGARARRRFEEGYTRGTAVAQYRAILADVTAD